MHYDIIIVGGGLAGKSMACALRPLALRVALIDANAEDKPDHRLIALNYGSFSFLNKIGIGEHIKQQSTPIENVHVSHKGHFGITRLSAKQTGLPALGYVVPAQEINQALNAVSVPTDFLTEIRPATVKAISLLPQSAELTLETPAGDRQLTGSIIIAVDGTDSTVRRLLNYATKTIDYQQSAIVTTCTLNRDHKHTAYERFLDDGALAMLPLPGQQCATIWTASNKKIAALMQLNNTDFLRELQDQFGYRLGSLQQISSRYVYPLHFIQVKNPLKNNVILIGNAAHTIHPVAAQGLNLAFYEIAHLVQTLSKMLNDKQSLADACSPPLIPSQQKTNLLLSHYLTQLFSSEFLGVNCMRQLGMIGLDVCPPLKKRFSRLLAMENLQWI